ncbi:MAG: hypothetical protein IPL41_17510 [Micropruina sp.]|nr:hypothetical protein [Micropruina sp.]
MAGSTITGTMTVVAQVSDNVGVTWVRLYAGSSQIATLTQGSGNTWTASVNTATYANGQYAISVRARDAAGNEGRSASVSVRLAN